MVLASIFLISVIALGALSTGLVLGWLRRRAILDAPNARSNHDTPTPRGGGIAIVLTVAAGWTMLWSARPEQVADLAPGMLGAALCLAVVSWIDDIRGLGASIRLPAHLAACAAGVWALPGEGALFQGLVPVWLDGSLTVLIWAGFLNFYNFMDGIDGITGVETIGVAAGVAALCWFVPTLGAAGPGLVLAAAAIGFLVWNWPPAKLFMGDVGSVPIGYCLGWFLILLASQGAWAAAIILPAYYLADAGLTLLRRAARMEKVWQAHREHFYQRAVAGLRADGASRAAAHRHVTARIAVVNAVLVALAIVSLNSPLPALVGAAIVVGALLWWLARSSRVPASS
jgi:UDP-N-acetylmuramyl pentapeptide phosphotransferase/UDP-N-acetylglucosamine-1-phosphate transferase